MRGIVLKLLLVICVFATAESAKAESSKVHPVPFVLGGLVGTGIGLGSGHLIQGRFLDKGYIFTIGEVASAYVFAQTFCIMCDDDQQLAGIALLAFVGLKVWEIIDLWFVPSVGTAAVVDERRLQLALLPNPQGGSGMSLMLSKKF